MLAMKGQAGNTKAWIGLVQEVMEKRESTNSRVHGSTPQKRVQIIIFERKIEHNGVGQTIQISAAGHQCETAWQDLAKILAWPVFLSCLSSWTYPFANQVLCTCRIFLALSTVRKIHLFSAGPTLSVSYPLAFLSSRLRPLPKRLSRCYAHFDKCWLYYPGNGHEA